MQDLVALIRTLADPRDTIALGALLRGPLVGLTEQELLDLAEALVDQSNGGVNTTSLSLRTIQQRFRTRSCGKHLRFCESYGFGSAASPALLLAEAVERLNVRAILVTRSPDQASRALANLDALLEKARAEACAASVNSHATSMKNGRAVCPKTKAWLTQTNIDQNCDNPQLEGVGWPVVIPINTASGTRPAGAIRASAKR